MSLESLIGADFVTFRSQVVTQDSSGGPVRTWQDAVVGAPARVLDPSADEQARFMALGTTAPHKIYHLTPNIGEGMLAVSSDGRVMKITGTQTKRGLGGISTYYLSTAVEWRPGA